MLMASTKEVGRKRVQVMTISSILKAMQAGEVLVLLGIENDTQV